MRIAIASDAWHPQVNGVVRSLGTTVERLRRRGHELLVVEPGRFRTVPCPTYPDIRLALACAPGVRRALDEFAPDAIHVATEGPVGWAARNWCIRRGRSFTTSFHTRFPDYVALRTRLPPGCFWPLMRRFHAPATKTFAVTPALAGELRERGIAPTHHWPLGVDLELFNPSVKPDPFLASLPRPLMLNVGRVAVEKNIEAFLDSRVEGTKAVVGDGPALAALKMRYPDVLFLGARHGMDLAAAYAAADVFVFPSRTDTFGLVNIEALACGLPVAAFPVRGPIDIIGLGGRGIHGGRECIGALDESLDSAIMRALSADREAAAAEARHYGWDRCTQRFLDGLAVENSVPELSPIAA